MRKISLTVLAGMLAISFTQYACSTHPLGAATPVSGAKVESLSTSSAAAAGADKSSDGDEEEDCLVAQTGERLFLPVTSEPPSGRILPATNNDCGFYNQAWQSFLYASRPAQVNQRPAFLELESYESVFGLKSAQTTSPLPLLNAGIRQAGDPHAVLVDQNHNPLYFSVYLNQTFADFVRKNQLNRLEALINPPEKGGVPTDLEFPPGSVELKAAWKIVEPGEDSSDYFTIRARVPVLKNSGNEVIETSATREVTVAMLSLHVVFVVQDHPEFIWATFEHANAAGERDLAPSASDIPGRGTQSLDARHSSYSLYAPGLPIGLANLLPPKQLLKEGTQKFLDTTSVYRIYPASLVETQEEDKGVVTLNQNIGKLFDQTDAGKGDLRRNYRLAGAVWIDEPGADKPDGNFKADRTFENYDKHKILAGEDGLSNMAMESFTQRAQPNCLSCHNTTGKMAAPHLSFPPRRVNVSNLLTLYARQVIEEKTTKK